MVSMSDARESSIRRTSNKPVIGWREWVSLPDLGIGAIKAKVDTGARSSALHAYDVRIVKRRGAERVRFKVHPIQRNNKAAVETEADLHERRWVRSSSGERSLRPVILTTVEMLGEQFEIELTLVNRDAMGFRMLLGRQAVRRRFVVDPGRSYFGTGGKTKRKKKTKMKKRKTLS